MEDIKLNKFLQFGSSRILDLKQEAWSWQDAKVKYGF